MIKFYSTVKKIEHKHRLVRAWKTGKMGADGKEEIASEDEDMGWFMLLEGSWEYLYVGDTEPDGLRVGDEVEVIIKRKE